MSCTSLHTSVGMTYNFIMDFFFKVNLFQYLTVMNVSKVKGNLHHLYMHVGSNIFTKNQKILNGLLDREQRSCGYWQIVLSATWFLTLESVRRVNHSEG